MVATHIIEAISFEGNQICLKVDWQLIKLPISKVSKKLESANDIQSNLYTISHSGYEIHWPLIDEDLFISSLLKNL